jgi:hypothetical protein
VNEPILLQGRRLGPIELEQIRQLLAAHPDWSRRRLSLQVATLWHWRNQVGQLKDMAARTLLLKLEQRGWIALPARRRVSPKRLRRPPLPTVAAPGSELPVLGALGALLPLALSEVSTGPDRDARARFESLLRQHHYLGYRGPVGQNLQYLVSDCQGRLLAAALFGAAAWQCADRDRYVGWDAATRAQGLPWIANNARFLVAPWVKVPHLASHVLGRIAQRLVKFRRNRFWTGDLRRGTEDLPKVRVQGIDPDFFARADWAVVFFQFAATLGLSEPDPISRPVGGAGKAWTFHEAFRQQRLVTVTQAPIGSEWFKDP